MPAAAHSAGWSIRPSRGNRGTAAQGDGAKPKVTFLPSFCRPWSRGLGLRARTHDTALQDHGWPALGASPILVGPTRGRQ